MLASNVTSNIIKTAPAPVPASSYVSSGGTRSRLLPILLLAGAGVGVWWWLKHRKAG